MSEFPKDSVLSFRAEHELSLADIRKLAFLAGRLGLEPLFDTTPADLSREDILKHYVQETYPTSTQSYLGKEHFRVIGDQLELPRARTSMIFTHLCFPITTGDKVVDPVDVGLNVQFREAVGMPKLEVVKLQIGQRSDRQRKHEKFFKDPPLIQDAVIQARGIIDLSRNPFRSAKLGIRSTYDTFRDFGAGLAEIIADPFPHAGDGQ